MGGGADITGRGGRESTQNISQEFWYTYRQEFKSPGGGPYDQEIVQDRERYGTVYPQAFAGPCVFPPRDAEASGLVRRSRIWRYDAYVHNGHGHPGSVRIPGDHGGRFGVSGTAQRSSDPGGGLRHYRHHGRCRVHGTLAQRVLHELDGQSERRGL